MKIRLVNVQSVFDDSNETHEVELSGGAAWVRNSAAPRKRDDAKINRSRFLLIPGGFMDMHCHGALARATTDLTREAYETISHYLAQHGVTSFLATIPAVPWSEMAKCANFAENVMKAPLPGARLDGVYFEGPYLNVTGGMSEECLKRPVKDDLDALLKERGDVIKIMALAPELPGALDVIDALVEHGVVPALGHSRADGETVREAVKRGARLVTHLGNNGEGDIRCEKGRYRHDGPLLEMLTNDELSAEIIMDGVHVDPNFVELFFRCKGARRCAGVTDVCAASGLEGEKLTFTTPLGEEQQFTVENGALITLGSNQLVGSLVTMDKVFANLRRFVGLRRREAAQCCGIIPRRIIGLPASETMDHDENGDFTIINDEGEALLTVVKGSIVHNGLR